MTNPEFILARLTALSGALRIKSGKDDAEVQTGYMVNMRIGDLRRVMGMMQDATMDAEAAIVIAEALLAREVKP